jgi:single-strand selective monofunctional uracil DNA glycosylase
MPRAKKNTVADRLVALSRTLAAEVDALSFGGKVAYVYNPIDYARANWEQYLSRYGGRRGVAVMLGMNPGPWGMAQTGVPFGEVNLVRDWLGIDGPVSKPDPEHPKRPVDGVRCGRSEVSGARLWGWARDRFGDADAFFDRFFVWNYCPLSFMADSGANITPDKLPAAERAPLMAACDRALAGVVELMAPRMLVGIGKFAEKRALQVVGDRLPVATVLHPSPASPIANRGWAPQAEAQLAELGLL